MENRVERGTGLLTAAVGRQEKTMSLDKTFGLLLKNAYESSRRDSAELKPGKGAEGQEKGSLSKPGISEEQTGEKEILKDRFEQNADESTNKDYPEPLDMGMELIVQLIPAQNSPDMRSYSSEETNVQLPDYTSRIEADNVLAAGSSEETSSPIKMPYTEDAEAAPKPPVEADKKSSLPEDSIEEAEAAPIHRSEPSLKPAEPKHSKPQAEGMPSEAQTLGKPLVSKEAENRGAIYEEKPRLIEEGETAPERIYQTVSENPLRPMNETGTSDSESLKTTEADIQEDVTGLIAGRLQRGFSGEISIELEPKNLGQIILKLSFMGGNARVSLLIENPRTMELLSRGAGEMARIIEQQTGMVTSVLIEEQEMQQGFSDSRNGSENRQRAEDELKRQQQENRGGSTDDFLQQLRLGLV